MTLANSKVIIYLDLVALVFTSFAACKNMILAVLGISEAFTPATFFMMVYFINLLLYRLCLNTFVHKMYKLIPFNIMLSILTVASILTTLIFVVYLIIMAIIHMNGMTLFGIICDYVTYATIVGVFVIGNLAVDNMTNLYNIFIKDAIK